MWHLGKEVTLWKYYLENFYKTTGKWKRPKTYWSCSHRHIYHIYLETEQIRVEATTGRPWWSTSNLLYLVLLQRELCLLQLCLNCQILIWHFSHGGALKTPVAKDQALKIPVGKNQLLQASSPGHLDAPGRMPRMLCALSVDCQDQWRSLAGLRGLGELRDLGIVYHSHNTRLLVFLWQHDVIFVRTIHCHYHTYLTVISLL